MLWFPGGEKREVSEESLDFAVKAEIELRSQYERAKQEKYKLQQSPPSYFNDFQYHLACSQLDDEINALSILLLAAARKLEWERKHIKKKKDDKG